MDFQYYWDYGYGPLSGYSSSIIEGDDPVTSAAVERLKQKALQAKGVVPRVLASVESGLDEIIGAESDIEKRKVEALAPHLSAISDTKSELTAIGSALDILTNGGPPLQVSLSAVSGSSVHLLPVDHGTGDPLKP